MDFPELRSLTINPLRATAEGLVALDASAELRPAGEAGWLAIGPYPAELVADVALRDGRTVLVRPIRPEDAETLAAAFGRLSPEDVRYRFFHRLRELPAAQLARLTQIDYDREMAFLAAAPDGAGVGVARLVLDPAGEEGEFAIVVDAAWKGAGLARHLMQRLLEWARGRGVRIVAGQVLKDNAPMLRFVRALGFTTRPSDDPEVVEARLIL